VESLKQEPIGGVQASIRSYENPYAGDNQNIKNQFQSMANQQWRRKWIEGNEKLHSLKVPHIAYSTVIHLTS